MDSNKRSAILLSLIKALDEQDSWCGETHIQKATFFLQSLTGVGLGMDFILYKHGPFSFDLRDELSQMRANQLVELKARPPYGPKFYTTENGDRLLDRFPKTTAENERAVNFVAHHLGPCNVGELERLATALLVSEQVSDPKEGARRLHKLKPHIDLEAAAKGIETVNGWKETYSQAAG